MPWRASDKTVTHSENFPRSATHCVRFCNKFDIILWMLPLIPQWSCFSKSFWQTWSNALLKSRSIESICSQLFSDELMLLIETKFSEAMFCLRENPVFIQVFHNVTVYDVFHEFIGYWRKADWPIVISFGSIFTITFVNWRYNCMSPLFSNFPLSDWSWKKQN